MTLRGPDTEIWVRITHQPDRTGVIESSFAGESKQQSFSWGLLSAIPDWIKIEQEMDDETSLDCITNNIDSPDRLTHADGAMKGQSMVA